MHALIVELREAASYCDNEFDADEMRRPHDAIESLVAVIGLADRLLMDAAGAFPLPGNPIRRDYEIIRSVSGNDYYERQKLAEAARLAGPLA